VTSSHDKPDHRQPGDPQDEDLWQAAWPHSESGPPPARPSRSQPGPARTQPQPTLSRSMPAPVSERRVYRAGNEDVPATRRIVHRSPVLAIAILVIIAVVIVLVGVGARGGGLEGSQNTGTFKLVPISTTTTS